MDFEFIFVWCLSHWQILLTCLLSTINIVIVLFKRNRVTLHLTDAVLTGALLKIPDWCLEAERKFGSGNGAEKLSYVLDVALHYLVEVTDYKETDIVKSYGSLISSYIENVLAAPSKK